MMLARISGSTDAYCPEAFGFLCENGDCARVEELTASARAAGETSYTVNVPILLYHHLSYIEPESGTSLRPDTFAHQMDLLEEHGYTPVDFDDLIAYVEQGVPLPDRAVVITFDDGYLSNYEYAFPVLQEHGYPATIFTIGFGDVNDELLQSIADQTGGQYLRAETSDELLQVYHSLQGIIGNTVTITYTVTENVEETYRYFFLRDEEGGVTVRREYTLTEAEPEEPAVTVTSTPFFQSRAVLDGLLAQQEPTFRLRITGTGLDTAAQVQIGGLDCGLERQEEDALELNVPAQMPDGVHDLTILTQEGEEYTFPQMLWVGNEVDVNRVQAGSVLLEADMALWLADGRLALRSVDLQDVLVGQETVNTLSLHLDGVMTFQVGDLAGRMVDGAFPDPLDLGDTGTAEGLGVLEISSGDSAYDRGADETILSGSLLLEYGAEQSHIKVSEVNEP